MQKRIDYIDSLKGFAMFLVVMGHSIAWSFGSYGMGFHVPAAESHPSVLLWWNVIYAFHMPLLLWISGFLFASPSRPFGFSMLPSLLWRRTYTLVIPYFVSGWIFHCFTGLPFSQYWFLAALFIFIVLSLPIELSVKMLGGGMQNNKLLTIIIYTFLYLFFIFLLERIVWLPQIRAFTSVIGIDHLLLFKWFVFGIMCRRYHKFYSILCNQWCYTISLIAFIFMSWVVNAPVQNMINSFTTTIYTACGIVCSVYFFKIAFNTEGALNMVLQLIGRHSLEIYILHFFFAISIPQVGYAIIKYGTNTESFWNASASTIELLYGIVMASILCVLSLACSRILRSSNLLSIVLLGRKNK